jgi:transposase
MQPSFLGIDVSKDTLDIVLRQAGKNGRPHQFANTSAGITRLLKWLTQAKLHALHACLEATGQYGDAVAEYLHLQGYAVSVVNPLCTKAYARSGLVRNQTDAIDAGLIAEFCEKQTPRLWVPPSRQQKTLRALSRRLEDLQATLQAENNRLGANPNQDPLVRQSLADHLAFLEQQIGQLKTQIKELVAQDPLLKGQKKLLQSIPGIGELTAARLLAELGDLNQFSSARQLAAFVGLTPEFKTSGSSVHTKPRLSKKGQPQIRKLLYMPAVVAKNHNPIVRAFSLRLAAAGKVKMSIIGAVMHKLVHLMFGVIKTGKPFDPNYLSKSKVPS